MDKDSMTTAEVWQGLCDGLPLFDQVARGFLEMLTSRQESGGPLDCLDYLDGAVKVDDAWCTRRVVVLAIEDLKRQVEAPLPLRSEAHAQMRLLKLDPAPELTLYRDLATAILRIDAALRLTRMSKTQQPNRWQPVHH